MSQPDHFKQVIQGALERNQGLGPEELTEKILERLDLADEIMGNTPMRFPRLAPAKTTEKAMEYLDVADEITGTPAPRQAGRVFIDTSRRQYKEIDLGKGVVLDAPPAPQSAARIVEEIAPPVAVVRNPDGVVYQETEAELEQKKQMLHSLILQHLPQAMVVNLPALEGDITLVRFVYMSPANMNFIRVLYAQSAEQADGPTVQLSTVDAAFDPAAIKAEILKQAQMRYRKSRQKIEPRLAPHPGMPNPDDLPMVGNPEEPVSPEAVADWERLSGRKIGQS